MSREGGEAMSAASESGAWGWDDILLHYSLVADLRDVASDLGIHASCAMQLAQALYGLGVEHVSGVFEVDAQVLSETPRIGPKAIDLARALGLRGGGR